MFYSTIFSSYQQMTSPMKRSGVFNVFHNGLNIAVFNIKPMSFVNPQFHYNDVTVNQNLVLRP